MMRKEHAKAQVKLRRDYRYCEAFREQNKFANISITTSVPREITSKMLRSTDVLSNKLSDVLVLFSVEMLPVLQYNGINNVVVATDVYDDFMRRLVVKYFGYKYMTLDEIKENNMKFDTVFANPPYEGTKCLHQRFFNTAVEDLVVDGGTVCFVQPSTPYDNKKPNQKAEMERMRENILLHTVNVRIIGGKVFKNAAIATQLAITTLKKDSANSQIIDRIEYDKDNSAYQNVSIEDVNQHQIDPTIYRSILDKINNAIKSNGSVGDLCRNEAKDEGYTTFRMQRVRGADGRRDQFTFISHDPKYHVMHNGFGVEITESEMPGLVSFFKTYLARFALSIYKYNMHLDRGELLSVPLVDFSKEWTDQRLMAEWGITPKEFKVIREVLPAYYDR